MRSRVHTPTYPPRERLPLPPLTEVTRGILHRCQQLNFAAAGIAPALPTHWQREVLAWLAQGRHATMDYLARDLELRFEPARIFEGTRAFIMVADLYQSRQQPRPTTDASSPTRTASHPLGRIARYAQGRDYHAIIKARLHDLSDALRAAYPGYAFRSFVDTVPVLERELAALAGLGWAAKNTMLIHPRLGSYTLLGGVATTLPLVPPDDQPTITDHCGTCTRCIDACPTAAITPYSVDASRCISYLTIEHRDHIPRAFHAPIGDYLYGCDICQDVCPHNSPRMAADGAPQDQAHPAYTPRHVSLPLLDVVNWTDESRREALKNSPMKRATLAMMKRNAIIAAGNFLAHTPDAPLLERLQGLSTDAAEPPLVTAAAAAVLDMLATTQRPGGDSNARPAV